MMFGTHLTVLALPTRLAGPRLPASGWDAVTPSRRPPRARRTLTARPYENIDEQAVLDFIGAEGSAGVPPATPTVPGQASAVADRSDGPDRHHTDVLIDQAGHVAGVVSYGVRHRDEAGLLLWLEGGDDPGVLDALVDHAVQTLDPRRTIYAYADALAPLPGRENIPARHRPATRQALLDAGFRQRDPRHPLCRPADWTVVQASGELDMSTAPDLRSNLDLQLQTGRRQIITDLSAVTFMDCAGLNVLINIRTRAREAEGEMRLVATHRSVLRLLRLTGLDTAFSPYPTLEHARRGPT